MKIKRHIRTETHWPWEVTGPGVEGKRFSGALMALAFAQMQTTRTGKTFYVREHDTVLYRTERREGVTVTVLPGVA